MPTTAENYAKNCSEICKNITHSAGDIVALGKTQSLPRFTPKGEVVAQQIMMINWSGDHRIIDGATMVKFNNLWMSYLQAPEKMLMHLR